MEIFMAEVVFWEKVSLSILWEDGNIVSQHYINIYFKKTETDGVGHFWGKTLGNKDFFSQWPFRMR